MTRTLSLPPYAAAAMLALWLPALGHAQSTSGSAAAPARLPSLAEVRQLAEMHLTLSAVHDSADARAAQAKNKTPDAQLELAKQKREAVSRVIKERGLTDEEYQRLRFLVSSNAELRAQFDSIVGKLTGAPVPGRVVAAAARGFVPAAQLPAGLVGTHIGHVTTSYVDTPEKAGLLVVAFAEAVVASQHATLATRTPTDLAAMKLHAGHVLHALDPSLQATGPGKGFGLRKAAGGVAQHIELAAKESGASGNVKIHATHIATAARGTLSRVDQAVALIAQIQAATDAKAAASLIAQLASLCSQLTSGADSNADGRVDWGNGEGGLQQADEHVKLMMAGERRPG
ncbi:MAG: DUF4168 domain-containing protein [Gemmatimonas sp.]|jgi:hypothetical protein|uniref:hypothetical protein n=1 Tax=Gemmatimonas sp. TaxID=1962908 RepID=UPI0025C26198|nr:hypothetical protein [Gemmatimonas sp.]MCE2953376.1 DUF4168 domain-containing protein [Gemmatimonas sp.]